MDSFDIGIKKFMIKMKNTAVTGLEGDSDFHPGSLLTLAARIELERFPLL